jgi:hypothetical protein
MGQQPQFIWIELYAPIYSRTYTYENKYSYSFLEPPGRDMLLLILGFNVQNSQQTAQATPDDIECRSTNAVVILHCLQKKKYSHSLSLILRNVHTRHEVNGSPSTTAHMPEYVERNSNSS